MRILITGAARLGAVMASDLMAAGHAVILHGKSKKPPVDAPYVIQPLDAAEDADALFSKALDLSGGALDAIICNAAAFERTPGFDLPPGMAERLWRTNTLAPMILTGHLHRHLAGRGASGHAIHILDQRIASDHLAGCLAYALSKKALADFTTAAAVGYAPVLRVNAVAPGAVIPPPDPAHSEKAGRFLTAKPRPEDVAAAVRFLLETPCVTGQILFVDGGQHLL